MPLGPLLVGVILLFTSSASVTTADPKDDPFAGVEELVVMGEGTAASIFQTDPIEMQVLDRLQIESQPNLSAADAVAKLPGIRTSQRVQGERAAVSIEGLPPEYTRILVNGQRYTGFVGSVADLEDVPLTNLDRVEIQRGAQGLRHGPDSGGGVINIRTLQPPEEGYKADFWSVFGSDNKRLIATSVGAANGPEAGATLAYTHDEIGGYDPRGSGAVFVNVGGKDSRRSSDDVYATQTFGNAFGRNGALRLGYREEEERYVAPDGEFIGGGEQTRWVASADGSVPITGNSSLRSALTYYDIETTNDIARETTFRDREIRGELGLTSDLDFKWVGFELNAGLDVRQLIFDLEEASLGFTPETALPSLTGDRDFTKYATTGGAYIALDARFTEWLSFTAGVRLQLDSRFGPNWAPQAGIIIEPSEWIKFRFQYGRSDRYPSLNDLFQPAVAQLGGVYFLSGNPDLVPEEADTWRAGFELSWNDSLSLSGTVFLNEIDGLIRFFFDSSVQVGTNFIPLGGGTLTPEEQALCARIPSLPLCNTEVTFIESPDVADLFVRRNLEYVRSRGVEAQLFWKPSYWTTLRAGYTYIETKIKSTAIPDLEQLPNEPNHTLDLEVLLTAPSFLQAFGEAQLSTVARFRSTALRETSGTGLAGFTATDHTSSSWVVDMRLQIPIAEIVTLNFDVRNITDETTVDSNEVRGRTYFGGLRIRWPVNP